MWIRIHLALYSEGKSCRQHIPRGKQGTHTRTRTRSAITSAVQKKYHITIDVRFYNDTGIGTYLQNILPQLVQTPDLRFSFICHRELLGRLGRDYPSVELIELNVSPLTLSEQALLPSAVPSNTDLLWIPHFNFPVFYRGRIMVTLMDISIRHLPLTPGNLARYLYARTVFSLMAVRASALVCISNFTRKDFERYYGAGEKLFTVHLGVSDDWFRIKKSRKRKRPSIVYIGNIKPHKNLKKLYYAFQGIKERIPHQLIIAGRIEGLRSPDHEFIELIAGDERVIMTGYLSREELKRTVAAADVFVFPSLYEGFGLPPLEAMACGVPCAVSDIPVLREVCQESALYFDPNDSDMMGAAILRIIQDSALKKKLVTSGKKRARIMSWDKTIAATRELLFYSLGKHCSGKTRF